MIAAFHPGSFFLGIAVAMVGIFLFSLCMIAKDDGTLFGEGPNTKDQDEEAQR